MLFKFIRQAKKRAASPAKKEEPKSNSGSAAKRGRGRPKGTFKKNGSAAKKPSGKGRGRPPKSRKEESTEEEEDEDDTEDNEDENDGNDSGSDA